MYDTTRCTAIKSRFKRTLKLATDMGTNQPPGVLHETCSMHYDIPHYFFFFDFPDAFEPGVADGVAERLSTTP